jgi:hypothetical protein
MTDTKKHPIHNAVRLLGETRLPGASLFLDGEIGPGAIRAAVGIAARIAIGPAGHLLVAADSYIKSTTGKSLVERVIAMVKPEKEAAKAPVDVPATVVAAE